MKKKFIIGSLCTTLAMTAAVAFTACGTGGDDAALSTAKDVYGLGAVSTVRLLGSSMPAGALKSFTALSAAEDNEVKTQAERFNEYFTALDSFLGDDVVSTTTAANTDGNYPYDIKMTINGRDFNGNAVEYVMYYTETLINTETDKDETESEYRLTGVMVIDGGDYFLEGERSEETERDETETELKIRAYADLNDKSSYVQMKQEFSEEEGETETEYVYSIYSNGKLIEKTSVEFETENKKNKTETEYELEFISGTAKGKYKVEREIKNGVTTMKVKYKIDGNTGEFRIREITGANGEKQYEYTFSDGSKQIFDQSPAV